MYPSTILFVLASVFGMINAAAIPQPGDPNYDTCIEEFGTVFAADITPGPAQCSGCAGQAFIDGLAAYEVDPGNVQAAKNAYNAKMVACSGPADRTYETCINEYGTIFAGEVTPGPVECTGCAGQAVAAGLVAYVVTDGDLDAKVAAAKDEYDAVKADCTGAL